MQRQLSALMGQSSAGWQQAALVAPPVVRQVATSQPIESPIRVDGAPSAVQTVCHDRPDLAIALERLAGIDPEKRQARYEEIRRELLQLGEGGQAATEPPASPQQAVLQAYQQVSRAEVPTALLDLPPS